MGSTTTYSITDEITPISKAFFKQEDLNSNMLDSAVMGTKIGAKTLTWYEQKARVFVDAVATEHTSGSGVLVVDTGSIFTPGDLIQVDAIVFSVSSISSNTLTVVVVNGSDATVAVDAVVTIISSAVLEGDESSLSTTNPKTESINVTQIFRRVAQVTDSAYETSKEVGDSQLMDDVADQSEILRKSMKKMVWNDFKLAPSNNTTLRIAGGIPYWITTNSGYIATAGTTMTQANLSAFVDYMVETKDYNLKEIWMNPSKASLISGFDTTYFQRDINSTERGYYADSFMSLHGNKVLIRTDRDIPVTKIYAVNSSDVKIVPFRDMVTSPLAKLGDSTRVQLVGEYTLEVNPANKMGVITFTA